MTLSGYCRYLLLREFCLTILWRRQLQVHFMKMSYVSWMQCTNCSIITLCGLLASFRRCHHTPWYVGEYMEIIHGFIIQLYNLCMCHDRLVCVNLKDIWKWIETVNSILWSKCCMFATCSCDLKVTSFTVLYRFERPSYISSMPRMSV